MVATALVGAAGLAAAPTQAAPLPATYTAAASGDVLTAQSTLLGGTLATTDLVHSAASVDSTSATPSSATSANLGLRVGPVGAGLSNTETAPPSHSESGTLASVGVPGVLSTGLLSYTDSVRWDGATSCVPVGTPLSTAVTQTAGASVSLLGLDVVETGVSSVTTSTSLVAVSPTRDTRGVAATTSGNVTGLSLLGGAVTVSALQPSLTATATDGAATGADLTGSDVTVTGPLGSTTLTAGASVTVTVPLVGSVVLRLASNADVTEAGGTFSTTYLTATVSLLAATGTVTLGILPLSVSATAPAGGLECDTTAPEVAITTPADGSTTTDTTPPVTGTSDVISGTVTLVLDGGPAVTVATDAGGAWSWTPTTPLVEGPHSVTVTATDAAGNTASDTSSFTVDVVPAVDIVTPANGSTTNDSTPAITGTSTTADGTVTVVVDGGTPVTVTTDADGDWVLTPASPLAEGPHTVTATATDGQGNSATDTTSFTVDTTAPTVAITTPADGSSTSDSTPAITGTSDVVSGTIQLVIDGGAPVTVPTDASGNWTHTPGAPLADGPHTVVATATDAAGNTGTDETTFTVDTTAPLVSITTPADGSTTNDATPAITGTSDVLSGTIQLVIDGGAPVTVPTDASGGWTYTPGTPLAEGPHSVVATATDAAGNTASDVSTFDVDTTAPVVTIVTPADGSSTRDSTPAITGTSDVVNGTVQLVIDGGTPVTVPTDASGNWSHTPAAPLADGPHTVVVTATDDAGNTGSDESTFTVDTVAPSVAITTPADGSTTDDRTPAITGTSNVLSGTIQLVIDGGTPVTVPTDATGAWTHTPGTPLANGAHTVVATATDAAGNSASDETTFTVTTPASDVTITSPEDGSTITDPTPDVEGTATPDATVVVSLDGRPGVPVRADGSGRWTLPAGPLACGRHTVTATVGTMTDAVTARSTFTVACPGSAAGAPASPGTPSSLPVTGSDPAALVGLGLLLTVAGAGVLRTARRRSLA